MALHRFFLAFTFLVLLIGSIVTQGYTAFYTTEIRLTVDLSEQSLGIEGKPLNNETLEYLSYRSVLAKAVFNAMPDVTSRSDKRDLFRFISTGAEYDLRDRVAANPNLVGQKIEIWALAGDNVNQFNKGNIDGKLPESNRQFKDKQISWFNQLKDDDRVRTVFNTRFFTNGDSRDAELAGIWGATVGSFLYLTGDTGVEFPHWRGSRDLLGRICTA